MVPTDCKRRIILVEGREKCVNAIRYWRRGTAIEEEMALVIVVPCFDKALGGMIVQVFYPSLENETE